MIRCLPQGLCSWDFRLKGGGHDATLEFNWADEQGRIVADEVRFEVRKHGVLSGHWTLERDGQTIVSGKKTNVVTRTFEINDSRGRLGLRPAFPIGRTFVVERANECLATFTPDHMFTRRATIDSHGSGLDFVTICFAFWLAVIMWRRAARSN